jgi:hypothetical protein
MTYVMTDRFAKNQGHTAYPEDHGTNEWLRILANEQAITNKLLRELIDKDKPEPEPKGAI